MVRWDEPYVRQKVSFLDVAYKPYSYQCLSNLPISTIVFGYKPKCTMKVSSKMWLPMVVFCSTLLCRTRAFSGARSFLPRPSRVSTKACNVRRFLTSPAPVDVGDGDTFPESRSTTIRHAVIWKTSAGERTFEARDGETLRTAALRGGVASPHNGRANLINCRGLGTCGTCAVEIQGSILPSERNTIEQLRLSLPPGHGPKSATNSALRLACQVQVRGDLTVTKRAGFWGQDDELAALSQPTQPFGDLEFLLDAKSPAKENPKERESAP